MRCDMIRRDAATTRAGFAKLFRPVRGEPDESVGGGRVRIHLALLAHLRTDRRILYAHTGRHHGQLQQCVTSI